MLLLLLDMESIDALAEAVNKYTGGLVLVSHDMRLISQVANEIWICDNKTITKYEGDIMNFKMDLRKAQGIGNENGKLKGDASVKATDKAKKPKAKKPEPKLEVIQPKAMEPKITTISEEPSPTPSSSEEEKVIASDVPSTVSPSKPVAATTPDDATVGTSTSASSSTTASTSAAAPAKKRYVPPHLRKKMEAEQAAKK